MPDHSDDFNDGSFDPFDFEEPAPADADGYDAATGHYPHRSPGESWVDENDLGPVTLSDGSLMEIVRDPHIGDMLVGGRPWPAVEPHNDNPPPGAAMPLPADEPDPEANDGGSGTPPTGPPANDDGERRGDPSSSLKSALAMAARGFRIFPLAVGSKVPPKGMRFKEEATTDPDKIRGWWASEPRYNIGIATGGGYNVVDVDVRKGGAASLLELDLPDGSLTVSTPGGGWHIYLRGTNVQNSVDRVGLGIDVRSAGGYVVGPGSFFADRDGAPRGYTGTYAVAVDAEMAEMPAGFVLRCGEPRARDSGAAVSVDHPDDIEFARHYLAKDAPVAIEGRGGNDQTYKVAARLIEIGVSAETIVDLMLEGWNDRCEPPWNRDELVHIAAHASTYAKKRQGSGGVAAVADQGGDPADAAALQVAPTATGRLGEWIDFETPEVPVQWLVKGLLPVEGAGFLTGLPNAGKSALAFDLADALARRPEWFGHPIRRRSGTIVLAFEGGRAHTLLRLRALLALAGDGTPAISVRYLDGLSKDELLRLPELVRKRARDMETRDRLPVRLLVLDTLGASGLLDDENDNAEIQRVFGELRKLGRAVGMFVLVIHHPTKSQSDDLSGGGALRRTADVVIRASFEDGKPVRELKVVKSREGVTGPLGTYKVRGVVAGTDEDGEPATAVVIEPVQAAQPGPSLEDRLRSRIMNGPDGPGTWWRKSSQSEHAIDRAFADELGYRYEIKNGRLKMDSPTGKRHVVDIIKSWLDKRWLVEFDATDLRGERRQFLKLGPGFDR